MASISKKQLETLRVNVWKLDKKIDALKQESELMKNQITILESIEEKTESGVEATITPERILTRRGSNSKKLALAQALDKQKK